jgi:heme/copper-type cytochrome/quinol oxidase subunit 2
MIRFLLVMIVVFALPFIAWKVRAAMMAEPPDTMPVGVLSLIGTVAAAIAMITLAALSIEGSREEGAYEPPRLDEGEVRPGRFNDDEPEGDPDRPSMER